MARVHEGLAQHGTAFFAHDQISGKGQRGKSWTTEKSSNICISVVVQPSDLELIHHFKLSACAAVATRQFFSAYANDESKIKWPNDIYWRDRKAAGILIENIISGISWQYAIIGIGININQTEFSKELPNPVSLKQITGKDFNTVELGKELCTFLNSFYNKLLAEGFESIYEVYNHHLYKKNEPVRLKKANRIFEAIIKGVAENGQLIVQHAMEERFDFGEVEWLI